MKREPGSFTRVTKGDRLVLPANRPDIAPPRDLRFRVDTLFRPMLNSNGLDDHQFLTTFRNLVVLLLRYEAVHLPRHQQLLEMIREFDDFGDFIREYERLHNE